MRILKRKKITIKIKGVNIAEGKPSTNWVMQNRFTKHAKPTGMHSFKFSPTTAISGLSFNRAKVGKDQITISDEDKFFYSVKDKNGKNIEHTIRVSINGDKRKRGRKR